MSGNRNIVLVGFMGTGKSSVGRCLSKALNMTFTDMDDRIVERAGKPVSRIFAEEGEHAFRALEREVASELSRQSGLVIATGGGVVLNPANIRDFSATGFVVCLTATPETIIARLKDDTTRPLLRDGNKLESIRALLMARQPLYDAIPMQVRTSSLSPDAVAHLIAERYAAT